MTLRVAHPHFGSPDFTIQQDSTQVANVGMSWWCEKGTLGSIDRTTFFSRDAMAELPDAWPLPVRAFVIWLTMVQWRRDNAA